MMRGSVLDLPDQAARKAAIKSDADQRFWRLLIVSVLFVLTSAFVNTAAHNASAVRSAVDMEMCRYYCSGCEVE